jgi:hypothetical protein
MRFVRLLLSALAALVLCTGVANAHEGNPHKEPTAQAAEVVVAVGVATSLSRSCPGVPGKACCCGALHALTGGGKATLADRRTGFSIGITQSSAQPVSLVLWAPSAPLPFAARPRAPPFSS